MLASQNVTLAWDSSSDPTIAGYRLYYGNGTGNYTQGINVGNTTTATLSNLTQGSTYFVVATAYNTAALESLPSNEIVFTVPSNPNLTATVPTSTQNCLVNGDFESGPYDARGTVTGWAVSSNGHIAVLSQGATSSSHSAAFNEGGDSQGNVLYQSFATVIGQVYTLDFDAGIYGQPTSTLRLRVQVFGGATLLDQTVTPPSASTFDPNSVVFQHYHLTFTANSTTSTLQFSDIGFGNSAADTVLDTVWVVPDLTSPPTAARSPTVIPKIRAIALTKTVSAGVDAMFSIVASKKPKWSPTQPTLVSYVLGGTATEGIDYTLSGATGQVIIPAGSWSTTVTLNTLSVPFSSSKKPVTLTILPSINYTVSPRPATVTIVNP